MDDEDVFNIAAFGSYDDVKAAWNSLHFRRGIDQIGFGGDTLIGYAAQFGNAETVQALLEMGADPNLCDLNRGGEPPIHHALRMGDADTIRMLLEHGVRLDAPGWMGIRAIDRLRRFADAHPNVIPERFCKDAI